MKSLSKITIYLVCLLCLASCGSQDSWKIKKMVAEVNKVCPIEIDYITTLEKVKFESPKTVIYSYTLKINLFDTNIEELKEGIKINIIYNILNNKDLKALRDMRVTFKYTYKNQLGKDLFDFTIDPDFYLSKQPESDEKITDERIYQFLQQLAATQNKQLPQEIEEGLDLYNIEAISPRTIEYIYHYKVGREDVDTAYLVSKRAREELIYVIKSNPNGDKILKDNDVIFRFTYCDKEGLPVTSIDITPQDYK